MSVSDLEGLIVSELEELKGREARLDRRFASLRAASPRTRASFLKGLMDLDEHARRVEELIEWSAKSARQVNAERAFV
jgi:hypothetical protein